MTNETNHGTSFAVFHWCDLIALSAAICRSQTDAGINLESWVTLLFTGWLLMKFLQCHWHDGHRKQEAKSQTLCAVRQPEVTIAAGNK